MFLPVLLVRDYGAWGFAVFAVPNIVGAAAMGWVLRDGASERLTRQHAAACNAFSGITIAFQAFFLIVVAATLRPHLSAAAHTGIVIGAAALGIAGPLLPRLAGSLLVWAASAGLLIASWKQGQWPPAPIGGELPEADLVFLAPVCVFGFLLCPYLDRTFHFARQRNMASRARWAFAVGFAVLFAAMIVGTLSYFHPAILHAGGLAGQVAPIVTVLIGAHIVMQVLFTIIAHGPGLGRPERPLIFAATAMGGVVFGLFMLSRGRDTTLGMLNFGAMFNWEVGYRLFMSFYGLLFPAYVWLCMIPVRGMPRTQGPTRRALRVLAIACISAAPFYWFGFIERDAVWLMPGLTIVLVARLFVNDRRSPAAGSAPASSPLHRAVHPSGGPR